MITAYRKSVLIRHHTKRPRGIRSKAMRKSVCLLSSMLVVGLVAPSGAQQQVQMAAPFQSVGSGFYENIGLGWNFSHGDFFVNVPNGVRPPFGMGDPNADARVGFQHNGFGLNLTMGQGSTTTNSMTSPMITMPNGGTGQIFHGSVRPFVTGFIPVVGGGGFGGGLPAGQPMMPIISPVQQKIQQLAAEGKLDSLGSGAVSSTSVKGAAAPQSAPPPRSRAPSSAERGDFSVAEIQRRQAAEDAAKPSPWEAAARKAAEYESQKKLYSARQYYKRAARLAPESQRSQWVREYERISRLMEE